ncbi:hypothetical protein [Photorhabdus sp. RM71S]|uniref:hypothetical protein n=1 Tax=Photorhabdus sp. RM71S TaxID=3342824 RepID=UPI0036D844C4
MYNQNKLSNIDFINAKHYDLYLKGKTKQTWDSNLNWNLAGRDLIPESLYEIAIVVASLSVHVEILGMQNAVELLLQCGDFSLKIGLAQAVNDEARHSKLFAKYAILVSDIVNEKVYPSYSFLWNYKKEYALPKHKDRNSVDYIISIGIHTKEEADWSLYVENKPVNMKSGDLLILDGKKFEHWREPCPYKNRLQLILCYTRDLSLRFDKRLHLGYDPVPEVITSPFKEKLSIDDDYIKELSTYYV